MSNIEQMFDMSSSNLTEIESVLKNIINGIIICNESGIIICFNNSAENIFGYSREEILGQSLSKMLPECQQTFYQSCLSFFEKNANFGDNKTHKDVNCLRKDGTLFPAEISISLSRIKDDKVFTIEIEDITTQNKSEDQLNIQQGIIRTINDAQSMYIDTRDPEVVIKSILPNVIALTGSDYGQFAQSINGKELNIQQPYINSYVINKLAPGEQLSPARQFKIENIESKLFQLIEQGKTIISSDIVDLGLAQQCMPGLKDIHALLCLPIKTEEQGIAVIILANNKAGYSQEMVELLTPVLNTCSQLIDAISADRKQQLHQDELKQAKQEAESAVIAKNYFLATISHEIRTPMNGVLGMLHLLDRTQLNDEQHLYVKTASNSGEILLTLINDILDFSKIEAGNLVLESKPFSPIDIIEETAIFFANQAHDKGLHILTFTDDNVPGTLKGDPVRLRQILTALVNNAIKFTEKGSVVISIHTIENKLRFSVVDTGIGISNEEQKLLFKAFTQVDRGHTRKYGGTGLGLKIAERLITAMGGELKVASAPALGSEFSFELSLEVINQDSYYSEIPYNLKQKSVALISEHINNSVIQHNILKNTGITQIEVSQNVDDMMLKYQLSENTDNLDFIILDIDSPDKVAQQLVDFIQQEKSLSQCKLIVLSQSDSNKPQNFPYIWLKKPIRLIDFINTLLKQLGEKHRISDPHMGVSKTEKLCFHGKQLLIVEDNEVNQMVANALFSDAGFQVDIQDNGLKAVQAVQDKEYDLVLMDIQMPVMDGIEATINIRKLGGKYQHLPILAMTAHALSGDEDSSLNAGMNAHITKPIEPGVTFSEIANWVEPVINSQATYIEPINEVVQDVMPNLMGIDIIEGIHRINGNQKAYVGILMGFYEKQFQAVDLIKLALREGQLDMVQTLSHSLKGSSGNISADKLYHAAAELEKACKEDRSDDYDLLIHELDSHHTEVMNSLDKLQRWQQKSDVSIHSNEQPSGEFKEVDLEELNNKIQSFNLLLDEDLGEAQNVLEEMSALVVGSRWETQVQSLNQALGQFDMDSVVMKIKEFIKKMHEDNNHE